MMTRPMAQGELLFEKLPDDVKLPHDQAQNLLVGEEVIVGHSETGHHHVFRGPDVVVLQMPVSWDGRVGIQTLFVVAPQGGELVHLRDHDTHEPHVFGPGTYEVTRARQVVNEPGRRTSFVPAID